MYKSHLGNQLGALPMLVAASVLIQLKLFRWSSLKCSKKEFNCNGLPQAHKYTWAVAYKIQQSGLSIQQKLRLDMIRRLLYIIFIPEYITFVAPTENVVNCSLCGIMSGSLVSKLSNKFSVFSTATCYYVDTLRKAFHGLFYINHFNKLYQTKFIYKLYTFYENAPSGLVQIRID